MKHKQQIFITLFYFLLFNSCCKIGEQGRLFVRFIHDKTFKVLNDALYLSPDGDNLNPVINGDYIEISGWLSDFSYVVDDGGLNPGLSSRSCVSTFERIKVNEGTAGENGADKYVDIDINAVIENIPGSSYRKFYDKSTVKTSNKSTYVSNPSGGSNSGEIELYNQTINGERKTKSRISVVVPANVKTLRFRTTETPEAFWNESDLFVKHGSLPDCNDDPFVSYNATCGSLSQNRAEDVCNFTSPIASGTWHVMLYNFNSSWYSSRLIITYTK